MKQHNLYIDGYFSRRILAGERPNNAETSSTLLIVKNKTMEIETGFLAAARKKASLTSDIKDNCK